MKFIRILLPWLYILASVWVFGWLIAIAAPTWKFPPMCFTWSLVTYAGWVALYPSTLSFRARMLPILPTATAVSILWAGAATVHYVPIKSWEFIPTLMSFILIALAAWLWLGEWIKQHITD